MLELLRKERTLVVLRCVGMTMLVAYLAISRDLRISVVWVGAFIGLLFATSAVMATLSSWKPLKWLNRHHFARKTPRPGDPVLTHDEWFNRRLQRVATRLRFRDLFLVPAEDGLICVPVLLAGISPLAAIVGGLVFGILHLAAYPYGACINKAFAYTLACLLFLPHGILNMVAGHVLVDFIAFAAAKLLASWWASRSQA